MHPDSRFDWQDRGAMLAFVAERAFSTLFVHAPEGGFVLHVPIVVEDEDRLRFHVARRNRGAEALDGARAWFSCTDGDFYVSPDWYGTADQVPTWNYVAVEGEGIVRRLEQDELIDQVDRLSDAHERRLLPKAPWTRNKMTPGRFEAMTRAIIGFELRIDGLRGTRKLGQNKRAEEREGAIAALEAIGRGDAAALMRNSSPSQGDGEGDHPTGGGGVATAAAPLHHASHGPPPRQSRGGK